MARKKKESAIEEAVRVTDDAMAAEGQPEGAPEGSRFVDIIVEEREVDVKLADHRKLEIAEQACEKHRAASELKAEIKAFADARKDLIKGFSKEAADLDEQFYLGTERVRKEVRILKDFAGGRLRVELIETGEVVEDREFSPDECQRDFAALLDADPSDQLLQRAVDVIARNAALLVPASTVECLTANVAENLGVSGHFAARIIALLKADDILEGDGSEGYPFSICDYGKGCQHCRKESEADSSMDCDECQAGGGQNFERADNCSGCLYARQLRSFAPCKDCEPNKEAAGFVAMPME